MKILLIFTWIASPGATAITERHHFDSMEDCQMTAALAYTIVIMERGGDVEFECVEA